MAQPHDADETHFHFEHASYPLPCHAIPGALLATVPPGLRWAIGLSEAEAGRRLAADWRGLTAPGLVQVRDLLLRRRLRGLAHLDGQWFLEFGEWGELGNRSIFLLPPPDPATLADCLASRRFPEPDVMAAFYGDFHGLNIVAPGWSGAFLSPADWREFATDYGEARRGSEPPGGWARAVGIYHSLGGDAALLRESGEVAWYVMPEQRLEPCAPSFSALLARFVGCLEQTNDFDFYSDGRTRGVETRSKRSRRPGS